MVAAFTTYDDTTPCPWAHRAVVRLMSGVAHFLSTNERLISQGNVIFLRCMSNGVFSLSRREGAYGTAARVGLRVFLFTLVDCILPASSIDIITGLAVWVPAMLDLCILLSETEVHVWEGRMGTGWKMARTGG